MAFAADRANSATRFAAPPRSAGTGVFVARSPASPSPRCSAMPQWLSPSRCARRASRPNSCRSAPPGFRAQPTTVALRLKMKPGWHVYWQNPGDSGLPTTIDWKLPSGFAAGPIQWPAPHALPAGPLINYGYEGEVLHLVDLEGAAVGWHRAAGRP